MQKRKMLILVTVSVFLLCTQVHADTDPLASEGFIELKEDEGGYLWDTTMWFTPDGHYVIKCNSIIGYKVWDVITGEQVMSISFEGSAGGERCVLMSPNRQFIVYDNPFESNKLMCHNLATGDIYALDEFSPGYTMDMEFTRDSRYVIAEVPRNKGSGYDITAYELASGKKVYTHYEYSFVALLQAPQAGDFIMLTYLYPKEREDPRLSFFLEQRQAATGEYVHAYGFENEDREHSRSRFCIDSQSIYCMILTDGKVQFYDLCSPDLECVYEKEMQGFVPDRKFFYVSPDCMSLAFLDTGRNALELWDLKAGAKVQELTGIIEERERTVPLTLGFCPDGKHFALTVHKDGKHYLQILDSRIPSQSGER